MVMPFEVSNSRLSQVSSYLDVDVPKSPVKEFDVSQVPLPTSHDVISNLDLAVSANQEQFLSHRESHQSNTKVLIEKSAHLYKQAEKAGIDVAKSAFFKELFNVAIAGVGLGLSIAATVISGGLGVPLTAAAGVAFALAVSDAGCAAANWYKAAHGEQGLKMGTDTLSNLVYALLEKMGMQDDRAEFWARATSATLRLGLTIGTLYAGTVSVPSGLGAATSAISTTKLAKIGASAAGNEILGFKLGSNKISHDKAKAELDSHKKEVAFSLDTSLMAMKDAAQKTHLAKLQEISDVERNHWEQKVNHVQKQLESNYKNVTEKMEQLSSKLKSVESEKQEVDDKVNFLTDENMRLKRELEALRTKSIDLQGTTEPSLKAIHSDDLQSGKIEKLAGNQDVDMVFESVQQVVSDLIDKVDQNQ
ncbi:hypothetical protein GCM10007938_24450 [Vibrio zhanjiangensis]|uniref:Uncharacterized protein n=1 Tax=Vibrio zhanjiangensis TaxID=1046128 RepID=A0ABQ6F0Y4_9VIBR|nr:hypothetical protein [Vibrio zhanjiangensis]GLT18664.1 hypothetical protein GCM10007938_24450 [Vibrio zhanjiangensis]